MGIKPKINKEEKYDYNGELKKELEKASIVVTDSETGFMYYKPAKTGLDENINLFDAFKLNGFGSMTSRSKVRTFNDILKLKALAVDKRFHFYTTTKGNKPFYYNGKVLLGVKSELSEEIRNENKKSFENGEDYTVVDLNGNAYKKLYFKEPVTFIEGLGENPNSRLTPVGMLDYTKESSVKYIAIEGNVLYQIDCCGYIQSKLFFGKSVNENLAVPYVIRFEKHYIDNKCGNKFEPYNIEERAMRYYKEDDMKDGNVRLSLNNCIYEDTSYTLDIIFTSPTKCTVELYLDGELKASKRCFILNLNRVIANLCVGLEHTEPPRKVTKLDIEEVLNR